MRKGTPCSLFYNNIQKQVSNEVYYSTNQQCLDKIVQIPSYLKNQENFMKINFSKWIHNIQSQFQMISIHDIDFSKISHQAGLWSVEYSEEGKRNYFILTYDLIFKDFLQSFKSPNLYEVIPVGLPSHLYFDVEFLFEEHPDYNGPEIIRQLLDVTSDKFFDYFGIDDYSYVNLDATSEKKFSRHIIIKVPGFAFKTNKHVGYFVNYIILPSCPEPVQNAVDRGVYSKNRTFRCVWCTKKKTGQNPLIPVIEKWSIDESPQTNSFSSQQTEKEDKEATESLNLDRIEAPKKLVYNYSFCYDEENRSPEFSTLSFFRSTLISDVDPNAFIYGFKDIDIENISFKKNNSNDPNVLNQEFGINTTGKGGSLADFVISKLTPGGFVDNARYLPDYDIVSILVKGTRYCHNIGREHKSNRVYILCRLSSGMAVQKCFDPDCKGFESTPVIIPSDLLEKARNEYHNLSHITPEKCNEDDLK